MIKQSEITYQYIHIENALIATDYLHKIASLQASFQKEQDYHIPKGLKFREEISRFWRIALAYWNEFQKNKNSEKWLKHLFKEILDFDIQKISPKNLNERIFPITHTAFEETIAFVITEPSIEFDKNYPQFGDGHKKRSPHALLQEYLNAEENVLWGFVSNGKKIRILRDNPSLTRPVYIEIDLEQIFNEELYNEFALFWLLSHSSRFIGRYEAIIEKWRDESTKEGERALNELRTGVTKALLLLGNGFLLHPQNKDLINALKTGKMSTDAYFQELLRLIYRYLFLFTAEERNLLFSPDATKEAKELYNKGYSLSRLRNLSLRYAIKDRFSDLWEGQKIVFDSLRNGQMLLGLPALGGLFGKEQCKHLEESKIGNYYLLQAIKELSFFKKGGILSRINYKDMDSEELGSVYESLLELIPQIDWNSTQPFDFLGDVAGNERKLTGSYYTPDDLVQELIHSALVPVIEEKLKNTDNPKEALLSIKVIDPASGSGHFLLASARKIAEYLAPFYAEDEPTQKEYRHALREVINNCIYGVDLNPLAVELCKTALWLEALEPGKPLGFLDSKIQCGNSLIGLYDGSILKDGIPNSAFKPLSGDDKEICKELAAENKKHKKDLAVDLRYNLKDIWDFAQMPQDSVEDIKNKAKAWKELQEKLQSIRIKEDLYTAAFFAPKNENTKDLIPTNKHLRLLAQGQMLDKKMVDFVQNLAKKYKFFHWHIAFAEVFSQSGGFDCVLGNPPWEKIKLQEKEFFSNLAPEIANAPNASLRHQMIENLQNEHPLLYEKFSEAKRASEASSLFIRSGRFPLTAIGDMNLYPLFAELSLRLKNKNGKVGIIVPTGISTDDNTKEFFSFIVKNKNLVSLVDFENREAIFPQVHRSYKFCLLTLGKADSAKLLFFATNTKHLKDKERWFSLTPQEFALINPNTKTCPVFRTKTDAKLTKKLYRKAQVLIKEKSENEPEINPWKIKFQAMFHMSNDSNLFYTFQKLNEKGGKLEGNIFIVDNEVYLPLYEAKMIHHYDHRWATYLEDGKTVKDLTIEEKKDPDKLPLPRYWVHEHEVLLRTANVQKDVKKALKDKDSNALKNAVTLWLTGLLETDDKRLEKIYNKTQKNLKDEDLEKAKNLAKDFPLTNEWIDILFENLENSDLKDWIWKLLKEYSPKFLMGWRDITNATNERTVIASVTPFLAIGGTINLMFSNIKNKKLLSLLLAEQCSIIHDYIARQKIGGTHLNLLYQKQLVFFSPEQYTKKDIDYILPRVLELSYTTYDMKPWAKALGYTGEPFKWDEERRHKLKCELDAYYAHLYGLTRDELRYILDPTDVKGKDFPSVTFPVLKRKEIEKYGEYRTQKLVLETYDRLAREKNVI